MRWPIGTLLFLVLLAQAGTAPGQAREIAIIAGQGFPKDRLTLIEVEAIYRGETQIINDIRISPIDQPHIQPIRIRFLEQVLQTTRDRYIDYWNRRLFRRGGLTPLLGRDDLEILEMVREKEGALGYIWFNEAEGHHNIKLLLRIKVD